MLCVLRTDGVDTPFAGGIYAPGTAYASAWRRLTYVTADELRDLRRQIDLTLAQDQQAAVEAPEAVAEAVVPEKVAGAYARGSG